MIDTKADGLGWPTHVVEDTPKLRAYIELCWGKPDKPFFRMLPIPREGEQ